jgi:regulator of protease activity HflC (stomatin/prohibitin superfamily)
MSHGNLHYLRETQAMPGQNSRSPSVDEIPFQSLNGYLMAVTGVAVVGLTIYSFFNLPQLPSTFSIIVRVVSLSSGMLLLLGLYMLHPKHAALLLLFGAYRGTDRAEGLRWANPLYRVRKISLRAHILNSERIKVNDKRGNPIEIAAAIVWRVHDTAKATFEVEDYYDYVRIQSEAAIRHLASSYAYDDADDTQNGKPGITLRSGIQEVGMALARALQERFDQAGIMVEDARLTHLAYAPEIAAVMLRRQQAEAIIAARQKIVTGAVTMVEMALQALSERDVVHLDDERKAAMVSNLMVVLCAERETQPIVNAGTLYT